MIGVSVLAECSSVYDKMQVVKFSDYNRGVWEKNRQPLGVTFEITSRCNFSCIHCYLGNHRTTSPELSYEEVVAILDTLASEGVLFLTLTGGEVLCRGDFLDIYLYAKKKGFLINIFTNGLNISDEVEKVLAEYPPFSVDVSIYGACEETYHSVTQKPGSFQKVMASLERLRRSGVNFSLKTPIISQNKADVNKMRGISQKLGVDYRFSFAICPTLEKNFYPLEYMLPVYEMFDIEIEDGLRQKAGDNVSEFENNWGRAFNEGEFVPVFLCNIAVNEFFVDFMGNMCPCINYRSKGVSLFENNFKEIWESFDRFKTIPATTNNLCVHCDSRYFCTICPAEQEEFYGDAEKVLNELCQFAWAKKMYFQDKEKAGRVRSFLKKGVPLNRLLRL